MNIDQIVKIGECGYIEYKRQWYWDLEEQKPSSEEFNRAWGEFIKDFLALVNANTNSFNNERFLVIGFDEDTQKFYDFSLTENLFKELKKKIENKITNFISNSSKIIYSIKLEKQDNKNIIIITIEQPREIHSLIKDIQTKSPERSYSANSVLCRKNSNSSSKKDDSVSIMPTDQMLALTEMLSPSVKGNTTRNTRKKSIESTINAYLESNKSLRISREFPKKSNDSEKYYELYELINEVDDSKAYFLYVSENSMEATIRGFKKDLTEYTKHKLSILIDKPTNIAQPSNRKKNVEMFAKKAGLSEFKIYFIDEFGKKHLYKEYLAPFLFRDEFPNTNNFIDNNVIDKSNNRSSLKATEVIKDWFLEDDSPIIVLTGMGGVGKTTLTKYFLNSTLKNQPQDQDKYVLFLDSSTLIDKLKTTNIKSIYDLYKADSNGQRLLTEELFRLSIDNGSFIIILDGLDEIISRMKENFDINSFFNKIYTDYCFNSAKTKIVITCRDSIWDETVAQSESIKELAIKNILLEPFDEKQAKEFFKSCFKLNDKLQNKAFNLVNSLISKSNDSVYNPFILDTISEIINDNEQVNIEDLFYQDTSVMKKLCLSTSSQTDYLIYAVCKREEKKLEIPFENQIKLLCRMCKYDSSTNLSFINLIEEVTNIKPNDTLLSLLKAHPFIFEKNEKVDLRYDFLRDFFTVILMAQSIEQEEIIDRNILLILEKKIGYLNSFSKEVAKRTFSESEKICINMINNIEYLSKNKEEHFDAFISSLFLTYLSILNKNSQLNTQNDLQEALVSIFGNTKNTIEHLCLCNINKPHGKPRLEFDFSDLKFDDFYIKNYSEFYNCKFNEGTLFKSGEIELLDNPNVRHNLKDSNFSDKVVFLGNTKNILENIKLHNEDRDRVRENNFKKFIKCFYAGGRFQSKKVAEIKAKHGNILAKMVDLEVILLHKESKLNEEEYKINPIYVNDLAKYLDSSIKTKLIISFLEKMA
jgi:hypothetical protein